MERVVGATLQDGTVGVVTFTNHQGKLLRNDQRYCKPF